MYSLRPKRNAQPLAGYATNVDFRETFAKDLKPLYLLAFLLTGRHTEAERCFVTTIEDALTANRVFRGWEGCWSKHRLIVNAIHLVFSGPTQDGVKPDACYNFDVESQRRSTLSAVATLASPLQRFVFVLSVLERYSQRECALLLGRTPREVAEARVHALQKLSGFNPPFTEITEQQRRLTLVHGQARSLAGL